MYWSLRISPLMKNLGLFPAYILLNFWHQAYAHYILCLPDLVLIKDILPITLQIEDENAEPEKFLEYNLI